MARGPTARASAVLVARRGERLLLVRQRDGPFEGAWVFPGGGVEPGESTVDAVRREVREETAVEPRDVAPLARYEVRGIGARAFLIDLSVFTGTVDGTLVPEEGSAIGWARPDEAGLHPTLRRVLVDARLRQELEEAVVAALRDAGIAMTPLVR